MGMKHILRALDQALETAEVERKYLRDALEAERVEKQRLAAEMDEMQKMAREPKAERDKLLETFREREIHCEGHMAGCTLVSQFGRLADMKEQMESVCQKNYEACAIYRMVMAEKYGGDEACRA